MKFVLVIFAVILLLIATGGRPAFAQQQMPQGIQRDQYDCYQQAQQAANLVRGHPNQQELIINLYYGCMKQKGYAVPAQQQQPAQQPQQQPPVNRAVPPPAPRAQATPQSSNQSGESAEDANNRANEFLLLLDPSLYTKD